MINFRYHLVSLIAIFLALGVGIVMGSTVIDQTIVEGLRGTIDRVERRADTDRKNAQVSASERDDVLDALAQVVPSLLEHRLDGVQVVVVAGPNSDPGPVAETVNMIRAAGGIVPAVIELKSGLDSASDASKDRVAGALGRNAPQGGDLHGLAVKVLAERLIRPAIKSPETIGSPVPTQAGDLLDRFRSAELLSFKTNGGGGFDLANYPAAGARFLLIDGVTPVTGKANSGSSTGPAVAESVVLTLTRALSDLDATLVVASTSVKTPRGQQVTLALAVSSIRGGDLKVSVSTVDTIERIESRAAVILALEDLVTGGIGHYGVGKGASLRVPK